MSVTEIIDELPKLSAQEREAILHRIEEIDGIDETPEMLAAIDEGRRSLEIQGGIPAQEVRKQITTWVTS
jgi:hypothetical protein